jgi:hypothetical protein
MAFLPPPKKTPLYLWIKITQKETKCADICFVRSKCTRLVRYSDSTVHGVQLGHVLPVQSFKFFEEYSINPLVPTTLLPDRFS